MRRRRNPRSDSTRNASSLRLLYSLFSVITDRYGSLPCVVSCTGCTLSWLRLAHSAAVPRSQDGLSCSWGYHMSKKLGGCAALGWREPCNQLLEPGNLPDDFVSERRSVRGLSGSVFVLPSVPSFCSSVSPKLSPVMSGALSRAAQPPAPNTDRMIMQHRQEGPWNASGRDNMNGLD